MDAYQAGLRLRAGDAPSQATHHHADASRGTVTEDNLAYRERHIPDSAKRIGSSNLGTGQVKKIDLSVTQAACLVVVQVQLHFARKLGNGDEDRRSRAHQVIPLGIRAAPPNSSC